VIITVDSSAFIAVLRNEPEARRFLEIMLAAAAVLVSAATYTETGIVTDAATPQRRKPAANLSDSFDVLLTEVGADIVPVTESMARAARLAYRRYGKGTGHKAQLNYGDCFSYALAAERATPLLFKGNDFTRTDIAAVI
jgi:ribonuclease VapC